MPTYIVQSLTRLKEFEGCSPWIHRDSLGRVAIGVGIVLEDSLSAQSLPFILDGRDATPAEITADFKRVTQMSMSQPPEFYKAATSPELAQDVIDSRLGVILTEIETEVKAKLKCYDALPDGVKLALLDMAYQLRPASLFRDYVGMIRSIQTGAWAQAAAESARNDASLARNSWTRSMFLSGAVVDTMRIETGGPGPRIWRRIQRILGS